MNPNDFIKVCAWCKIVQDPDLEEVWIISGGTSGAEITHGMCGKCLAEEMEDVK